MNIEIQNKESKETHNISLDEKNCSEKDIFCFVPNRNIICKSFENLCFLNYGPNTWNYKQNARKVGYELGDNKFQIIDSSFCFKIHRKIGLRHDEEVDITLLAIELFLDQDFDITVKGKPSLSEKESIYFEKLIKDKRINSIS